MHAIDLIADYYYLSAGFPSYILDLLIYSPAIPMFQSPRFLLISLGLKQIILPLSLTIADFLYSSIAYRMVCVWSNDLEKLAGTQRFDCASNCKKSSLYSRTRLSLWWLQMAAFLAWVRLSPCRIILYFH
jgi:hypothetical protein